jgi:hypothetical protein
MTNNKNGNGNVERWRVEFHLVGKKYGRLAYWQPEPHRISKNGTSLEVAVKEIVKTDNGYKFLVVTISERRPAQFIIYLNWSPDTAPHWGVVRAKGNHMKGFI